MIQPKSFLSPFIDKRNLIAIILVAVFFGFYRMAGGTLSLEGTGSLAGQGEREGTRPTFVESIPIDAPVTTPAADLKALERSLDRTSGGTQEKGAEPQQGAPQPERALDRSDRLDALLDGPSSGTTVVRQERAGSQRPASRLDDIERSLGLR